MDMDLYLQQPFAEIVRDLQRRLDRMERRSRHYTSSRHESNRGRDDTSSSYHPRQSHVKKLDTCHVLVTTPEEIIVAVEEEPIQEPPLQEEELLFSDEHDEPTIELIGGPRFDPEYIDEQELLQEEIAPIRPPQEEIGVTTTKESLDVIPCMILPAEPPNKLALIRENLPVIMKRPLPPRENDRVVKPTTDPWMGRLGVQGGTAHLGPADDETGPPRAGLRRDSGFLSGNPWDPGIN